MMSDLADDEFTERIVRMLASLWDLAGTDDFRDYIRQIYDVSIYELPHFKCLYIAESEEGHVDFAPTGPMMIGGWAVDSQGLRRSRLRPDWGSNEQQFCTAPLIKFYREHKKLVTYERLGKDFRCWRTGSLQDIEGGVVMTNVNLRTVWQCW